MTNTKKNEFKERREWQDLQNKKLAYMKRLQEEEETKDLLRNWQPEENDDASREQVRRDSD